MTVQVKADFKSRGKSEYSAPQQFPQNTGERQTLLVGINYRITRANFQEPFLCRCELSTTRGRDNPAHPQVLHHLTIVVVAVDQCVYDESRAGAVELDDLHFVLLIDCDRCSVKKSE